MKAQSLVDHAVEVGQGLEGFHVEDGVERCEFGAEFGGLGGVCGEVVEEVD